MFTTNPSAAEILAFCVQESSAAFELQVLKKLSLMGLTVQHGESYLDPLTGKFRQLDLFTTLEHLSLGIDPKTCGPKGGVVSLFPIECKQVHPCPLIQPAHESC